MKAKILLTILSLSFATSFAQKQEVRVADRFFKDFAYKKAAELYGIAVKKGDSSLHTLTRLGDCYYNNSNSEKSAQWYEEAIKRHESKIGSDYLYKYSVALRGKGEYEQAIEYLEKYKENNPNDDRIAGLDFDKLELYEQLSNTDEVYVTVENLPINSKYADFGVYERDNKIYFSSARDNSSRVYDWNNEPFLDIYEADITEEDGKNTYGDVNKVNSNEINTPYHEASVAITKDGQTMYFTRDNVTKGKKLRTDREGTSHLKIYKATFIDSTWQDVEELPFNDKYFSSGHPTLSPDDKHLYFVSDREGGFGQTDIYRVAINADGTYGEPENLGDTINSDGKEMFPFIAKDSTLYFSSDSNINLGFLDIFKSNILKGGDAEVENLGAPFNSGADDFGYYVDSDTDLGYFSSNRGDGQGSDDIYGFIGCAQKIKGTIRDSITLEPIHMATVKLINEEGKILKEVPSDSLGLYEFKAKCNTKYTVLAEKMDYKDNYDEITTGTENSEDNTLDLNLVPLIQDGEIVINPIFFDFDKWDIRADAAYELENIVAVLRDHPDMVIKIEAHTDSRGGDRYNMKLSERRAKSTRDYLLSRDIAPERIESAIGYGESQLVNECSNGVKCTKEQHQENRRSKFIIISE
jgi:outer membrane protein OmpA-like peptidoglycan-associated protein/tetratricopeptide (TPR) repeat protein